MYSRERVRGVKENSRCGSLNAHKVLRRLSALCDGRQYVEAAHLLSRLGPSAICMVATEMPLDLLADALPYSVSLLECLFSRLVALVHHAKPEIPVESVIWNLVKLFGTSYDCTVKQRCEKLIAFIGSWKPDIKTILNERQIQLNNAVHGLGVHGVTQTVDNKGNLISLHAALKIELQLHAENYKSAISIIDESITMSTQRDVGQLNHQRLLSHKYNDIQQRLIDNKKLLTKLETPCHKVLTELIEKLKDRVEKDKNVLICINQIKKIDADIRIDENPVANVLMDYSRGCKSIISLISPIIPNSANELGSGSSEGYHSESDSDEQKVLVEEYHALYKIFRNQALIALNEIYQLDNAQYVKCKVIFSIVVLAFRSCYELRDRKLLEIRRSLNAFSSVERKKDAICALDHSLLIYLQSTADVFPLEDIEKLVTNQVFSTLHEYPCINATIAPLKTFVEKSVRLAWKMSNQLFDPYYLDMDFSLGIFNQHKQTRSPISDMRSMTIQSFMWPALFQKRLCVYKAIVVT